MAASSSAPGATAAASQPSARSDSARLVQRKRRKVKNSECTLSGAAESECGHVAKRKRAPSHDAAALAAMSAEEAKAAGIDRRAGSAWWKAQEQQKKTKQGLAHQPPAEREAVGEDDSGRCVFLPAPWQALRRRGRWHA
jgi:hypothetical protein